LAAARNNRPRFLIIAGPNGSGKSTAYEQSVVELGGRAFRIINPDLLSQRLESLEGLAPDQANRDAVERIESWLETSILAGHTVGVETVLSTPKYRRLVEKARKLGFEIQLIYVMLKSVELNVERVALRVKRGGHPVPEEKIRQRHQRSLAQLPWFFNAADLVVIYDNSGATPQLIGEKKAGMSWVDVGSPEDLLRALL
jgi:predicted ABC-type ATPase